MRPLSAAIEFEKEAITALPPPIAAVPIRSKSTTCARRCIAPFLNSLVTPEVRDVSTRRDERDEDVIDPDGVLQIAQEVAPM